MLKKLTITGLLVGTLSFAGGEHHSNSHWGYTEKTGPEYWGELSPDYIMCKIGKNQSPIDINTKGLLKGCLEPIKFNYVADAKYVINNGHTVKVVTDSKSYIIIDGRKFYLRQFHFHSPSEHTINGKHYPFEAHFVHTDSKGNIAVIGVLFKLGKENPTLQRIWNSLPTETGKKMILTTKVNPYYLLPENKDYYRYSGSLTTPPCSEGVRWFVMKETVELSRNQLEQFKKAMKNIDNNRPVQPLNARKVIY